MGFTACNARLIDGQGKLIAGCVYWFGKDRASADRDRAFAPIDPTRAQARCRGKTATLAEADALSALTKRVVHWVWVSTSSMMFRRSLIDLVFPDDDETFRLHMDFYVVVMAQMVAGSLLIDEALSAYRLHGRNGAADNPVGRPPASVQPKLGQHLHGDAGPHACRHGARSRTIRNFTGRTAVPAHAAAHAGGAGGVADVLAVGGAKLARLSTLSYNKQRGRAAYRNCAGGELAPCVV